MTSSSEARLVEITRLTRCEPIDLDALIAHYDPRTQQSGIDIAPCRTTAALPPCPLARPDAIAIGALVTVFQKDPADVAFRLLSLATEQDLEVIVFTDLEYSGLERFGLRTERIVGTSPEERRACIEEVKAFWGIELIIPV
jgi:hypothetical protein